MPNIPFHTHEFTIPTATEQEVADGLRDDVVVTPAVLGGLAAKDEVEVADIDASGTPSAATFLRGDGSWVTPAGGGDMAAALYDPQSIQADVFDRANHTGQIPVPGALAASGTPDSTTFLRGDGAWAAPAGSGDVSKVGTPVDNQIGVWTGDGTIEGDAALTFDTATNDLRIGSTGSLSFGADPILVDNAGVMTLTNIDALSPTTEATIEAAIDTLSNLASIQGVSFTFGAYAATLLNNASETAFKAAVNLEIGVDVQAFDELLNEIAALSTDPNVDSGLFFDDSAGAIAYWTPTGALSFSGINLTVAASSTTVSGVAEIATAAEYRAGTDTTRHLGVAEAWSGAAVSTLTDAATIAVDLAAGFNFGGASNGVLNLGGNRTLGAPSNVKSGQTGILWFGATGATRTLTLNAAWLLFDGVEVGPHSITTAQILGLAYVTRGTSVFVTAILRRAA